MKEAEINQKNLSIGKPKWLKTEFPSGKTFFEVKETLRSRKLVTVCEEAKCPNIGYCWGTKTATFMILGDTCTRGCRFCHIKTGDPKGWVNPEEAKDIALSCQSMNLSYVVITMVDRDDLKDGGAEHIHQVVSTVRSHNPNIKIELLCGDLQNHTEHLATVLQAPLAVFAHNLETVERLTPRVRDARASYRQSLSVLGKVKDLAPYHVKTKSALMLGLGETLEEVKHTLEELRAYHVDFITIGQYMRPTKQHLSIKEWIHPEIFQNLESYAKTLGFLGVASAPLVRSSFKAKEFYENSLTVTS